MGLGHFLCSVVPLNNLHTTYKHFTVLTAPVSFNTLPHSDALSLGKPSLASLQVSAWTAVSTLCSHLQRTTGSKTLHKVLHIPQEKVKSIFLSVNSPTRCFPKVAFMMPKRSVVPAFSHCVSYFKATHSVLVYTFPICKLRFSHFKDSVINTVIFLIRHLALRHSTIPLWVWTTQAFLWNYNSVQGCSNWSFPSIDFLTALNSLTKNPNSPGHHPPYFSRSQCLSRNSYTFSPISFFLPVLSALTKGGNCYMMWLLNDQVNMVGNF